MEYKEQWSTAIIAVALVGGAVAVTVKKGWNKADDDKRN